MPIFLVFPILIKRYKELLEKLYLGKEFLKIDKNYSTLKGLLEVARKKVRNLIKLFVNRIKVFSWQAAVFTDKFRGEYAGLQYVDSFGKSRYKIIKDHQHP